MSVHIFRIPNLLVKQSRSLDQLARSLTTSSCLCGKKTRKTFDRRFPLSPKEVSQHKEGGSKAMARLLGMTGHMVPQEPGYTDKNGRFVFVPEMVPEFVVPDITDFKLKPYVSYKVTDVKQSEFTAKDFFDAVYGEKIVKDFQDGKLDEKDPVKTYTGLDSS